MNRSAIRALAPVLIVAGVSSLGAQHIDANRRPARPELLRVERPVYPAAVGPNRLDVDIQLLTAAEPFHVTNGAQYGSPRYVGVNGLSDFRLYTTDGREVPYVLIPPYTQEPTWWPSGKPLPIPSTDTSSGFEVDLGRMTRADRLELRGAPSNFLKRVRLDASGDRVHWTVLVQEGTVFSLPDEQLRQLTIDFTPGEYRYFRLTWDDRNSARVALPSDIAVRVTLPPALTTAPLAVHVPFERIESEPRASRFRVRMPAPEMPIIALELSVAPSKLLRQAEVYEQVVRGSRTERTLLGGGVLRRAVIGAVSASELRIAVQQPTSAELELVVQDGDNPPLALTGVTAVFAMLPYIYFEAPSTEPLVARYDGDAIDWPRYDLEAVKDSVYNLKPAPAVWGEPRRHDVQVVSVPQATDSSSPPAIPARGTAMDPLAFRWRRSIPAGPVGPTVVKLDAAVLAHSQRYDDLRILDGEQRQVAYVIDRATNPITIDLGTLEKVTSTGQTQRGTTRYRMKIPYTGLPDGELVLATNARVFQRRVWVEAKHPAGRGRREPWVQRVTEAEWRHDEPGSAALPLVLRFPTMHVDELHLAVDEGDNAPLPIVSANLVVPTHQIRFVRTDTAPLTLLYGNRRLAKPVYDLALLRSRVTDATAHEVRLGVEEAISPRRPNQLPTVAFWAILGVAVLAMLFMIWRLVAQVQGDPSEEPIVKETG